MGHVKHFCDDDDDDNDDHRPLLRRAVFRRCSANRRRYSTRCR